MRIDVGGYALNYELTGDGPETLTLTHGLGDHSGTWVAQLEQLSKHYRILTWDLRAHGKSDSPAGEWTINDLSGDLRRLLTVLEIPSTHLLGHSAGGAISTHFALQYPHQVQSLTLVGSASEANEKASKNYERLAQKAEQEGGPAILKAVGLKDKSGVIAPDGPGFAKAARCMSGLYQNPLTPRLQEIVCPVLVIVGEKDFMGQGGSHIFHRNIPGSRLEVVKDRGHALSREDPEEFNQLVLDFVRGVQNDVHSLGRGVNILYTS